MKEQKKYIWKIKYRGGDGLPAERDVIAESYEVLSEWLAHRIWVNTVTSINIANEITELVEDEINLPRIDWSKE